MIRIESDLAPEEEILTPTAFPDGTNLLKFDPQRDEYTITFQYTKDSRRLQEMRAKTFLRSPP